MSPTLLHCAGQVVNKECMKWSHLIKVTQSCYSIPTYIMYVFARSVWIRQMTHVTSCHGKMSLQNVIKIVTTICYNRLEQNKPRFMFLFLSFMVYYGKVHKMLFILIWWKLWFRCHIFVASRVGNATSKLRGEKRGKSNCRSGWRIRDSFRLKFACSWRPCISHARFVQ